MVDKYIYQAINYRGHIAQSSLEWFVETTMMTSVRFHCLSKSRVILKLTTIKTNCSHQMMQSLPHVTNSSSVQNLKQKTNYHENMPTTLLVVTWTLSEVIRFMVGLPSCYWSESNAVHYWVFRLQDDALELHQPLKCHELMQSISIRLMLMRFPPNRIPPWMGW